MMYRSMVLEALRYVYRVLVNAASTVTVTTPTDSGLLGIYLLTSPEYSDHPPL